MSYKDEEIKWLEKNILLHGNAWPLITKLFNEQFHQKKTDRGISQICTRLFPEKVIKVPKHLQEIVAQSLNKARNASTENVRLRKTQQMLLNNNNQLDDVLRALQKSISNSCLGKHIIPQIVVATDKKEMAVEILLSDIHALKKGFNFSAKVLEKRLHHFSNVCLQEIENENVSVVILAILGDLIENSYFHNMESMSGCEEENSEQIRLITDLLYRYFILPLALTGKRIIIPCIAGNHDRALPTTTYNSPGKNALTWIIYNFLKMLAEEMGLSNLEFIIPEGLYCTVEVFGRIFLYEHGSEIRSRKEEDMETFLHKRSKQLHKLVDFFRIGDKHTPTFYSKGRIIINGCVCGQDSYGDSKGYHSTPCQLINTYIQTPKGGVFYKCFPVDLA